MAELGFDVMRPTPWWAGSELMAGDHSPSTSAWSWSGMPCPLSSRHIWVSAWWSVS